MKRITIIAALALRCLLASAQADTLFLSTSFTTHVIFSTDLTYVDLSNSRTVVGRIVEQNKNMLALKARTPFIDASSVSALESNGKMHTFIIRYAMSPERLVIDKRDTDIKDGISPQGREMKKERGSNTPSRRVTNTPTMQDVKASRKRIFNITDKGYGLTFHCDNIVSCSDMIYFKFSLSNKSGIGYDAPDATFVIEGRKKGRRTVSAEKTIFPKSKLGSLSAEAGESSDIVYSFDKLTLSKDQRLKVYLYEDSGARNLTLSIDHKDINKSGWKSD